MGKKQKANNLQKKPAMIITINDDNIINKKDFLDIMIKLPPSANEVNIELKPVSISKDSSALGNIK